MNEFDFYAVKIISNKKAVIKRLNLAGEIHSRRYSKFQKQYFIYFGFTEATNGAKRDSLEAEAKKLVEGIDARVYVEYVVRD